MMTSYYKVFKHILKCPLWKVLLTELKLLKSSVHQSVTSLGS